MRFRPNFSVPAVSVPHPRRYGRAISSSLTVLSITTAILSSVLTVILLTAGSHFNPASSGSSSISGASNFFISFAAPFRDWTVTWPNGTMTKATNRQAPWSITWHLTAVAAHPPFTLNLDNGALIVHHSPARPFNVSSALEAVEGVFKNTLEWTIVGAEELDLKDPRASIRSRTLERVRSVKVSMICPFIMWMLQVGASSLAAVLLLLYPCFERAPTNDMEKNKRREKQRQRSVRAAAFLMGTALLASVILVLYMTGYAAWAAKRLKSGANAELLQDVKMGGRALGILWGEMVTLAVSFVAAGALAFEVRDVAPPGQAAGQGRPLGAWHTRRVVDDEIELDPPPPYERSPAGSARVPTFEEAMQMGPGTARAEQRPAATAPVPET